MLCPRVYPQDTHTVPRIHKQRYRPLTWECKRRFPKGDRKALWSPPQRRNPLQQYKTSKEFQPLQSKHQKETLLPLFPQKRQLPPQAVHLVLRAHQVPPDSAPSAPPPYSPESARNASSPSSAGQHTPPPGSDAPANPSKQGRSPSLPPEPSFSASPCFRSYEIQAQSGCLRRVCACNIIRFPNENAPRCAGKLGNRITSARKDRSARRFPRGWTSSPAVQGAYRACRA